MHRVFFASPWPAVLTAPSSFGARLAKPLAHIDPDSAMLEWHRKMEIELRRVHALAGEAEDEDEQGEERDEEDEEEEELRRLEDGDPNAEDTLTQ